MTTKEAIYLIREKRPGSVQMNEQIDAIKLFENFMIPLRTIYPRALTTKNATEIASLNGDVNKQRNMSTFNLSTFLNRQKLVLHGVERKKLKYIPKVIFFPKDSHL